MEKHTDQVGRFFKVEKTPQRIVSLVPSQTELLVDLGLRDQIVGVTKFCVHPGGLRNEKKLVGGTKNVNIEKVEELKPDIILCNKEENTEEMVLALQKIAPVHVSDIKNLEDTLVMITQYGAIFEKQQEAAIVIEKIKTAFSDFEKFIQQKESKRVAYFIWKNPWMLAGKDTFIDYLLQLNKFENVAVEENSRYPEIKLKKLKEKQPELICLSSEPYPFKQKHIAELQPDFPNSKIIVVDGEYFSWYGSRLIDAFSYFKKLH